MARYFIFLSFRGTAYHGWQIQPGRQTVQGLLSEALSTILRSSVSLTGAGRTDAGVHASFFCAHFDISSETLDQDARLLYRLNSFLPNDIAISRIARVTDEAHSRFDALTRTYRYTIATIKDPFSEETSWLYTGHLDLELMNEAASLLTGVSNFRSFCRLHGSNKTDICRVSRAQWHEEYGKLIFTITADRFLRNMVRAITGTLVAAGSGRITLNDFRTIIAGRDRALAGQSAPAAGLSLTAIDYPPHLFP